MKIHPSKIGLGGSQSIRVMNLHGTAEQVSNLVDGEKYFPGYHMNRKYWYTVCLDGSVPMNELRGRIDESFNLSQPRGRKTSNIKAWWILSNDAPVVKKLHPFPKEPFDCIIFILLLDEAVAWLIQCPLPVIVKECGESPRDKACWHKGVCRKPIFYKRLWDSRSLVGF